MGLQKRLQNFIIKTCVVAFVIIFGIPAKIITYLIYDLNRKPRI